jgi:hypothetical protein
MDCSAQQPTARVVAAHGDSVLFEMVWHAAAGSDYFVYRAGGSRRPPSLSRLPSLDVTVYVEHRGAWERREIGLFATSAGILRRGEEELLVAQLAATKDGPELCVLRLGRTEWEVKTAVPITLLDAGGDGDGTTVPPSPSLGYGYGSDKVVPVGDRFLCWVHYHLGVLVCDMAMAAERRPELRYAPPPVSPPWWKDYYEDGYRPSVDHSRDVCV